MLHGFKALNGQLHNWTVRVEVSGLSVELVAAGWGRTWHGLFALWKNSALCPGWSFQVFLEKEILLDLKLHV